MRSMGKISDMKIEISLSDVEYAKEKSPWDKLNQVLYDLCKDNPEHKDDDVILAKMMLIGRTYAAAIERRKISKDISSDSFYKESVVNAIKNSDIDIWLKSLPYSFSNPWVALDQVAAIHKNLMDIFYSLTHLNKRSLASKYLHFHKPNIFYIYDSRAKSAITKITKNIRKLKNIEPEQFDEEYLGHYCRCQWLVDDIKKKYHTNLLPREIDNILLKIDSDSNVKQF